MYRDYLDSGEPVLIVKGKRLRLVDNSEFTFESDENKVTLKAPYFNNLMACNETLGIRRSCIAFAHIVKMFENDMETLQEALEDRVESALFIDFIKELLKFNGWGKIDVRTVEDLTHESYKEHSLLKEYMELYLSE